MHSTPVAPQITEEYTMPCAAALLAGTLALMTGHVRACSGAHREAMVGKIVWNLTALTEDPVLSPSFKTLLWSLRSRWLSQSPGSPLAPPPAAERGLWHNSPEAVQ